MEVKTRENKGSLSKILTEKINRTFESVKVIGDKVNKHEEKINKICEQLSYYLNSVNHK